VYAFAPLPFLSTVRGGPKKTPLVFFCLPSLVLPSVVFFREALISLLSLALFSPYLPFVFLETIIILRLLRGTTQKKRESFYLSPG